MDSLYLLLPLSVLLVLALIALFAWALHGGQFDDLEREGWRVLDDAADDAAARQSNPTSPTLDFAQAESAGRTNNHASPPTPRSSP